MSDDLEFELLMFDREPCGDFDDAQRVSLDEDWLRGTRILGPEGQELIYTPDEDYEPFTRAEIRAMAARFDAGPSRYRL